MCVALVPQSSLSNTEHIAGGGGWRPTRPARKEAGVEGPNPVSKAAKAPTVVDGESPQAFAPRPVIRLLYPL